MKYPANARITTFTRLTQANLLGYGQNVHALMADNTTYESLSGEIERLNDSLTVYAAALSEINTGAYNATVKKNESKKVVLDNLRVLASAVSANANGAESYITGAGFHLWNPRSQNRNPPQVPSIAFAKSTGNPGQLQIKLDKSTLTSGATYFFEISADQGTLWTNGIYDKRESFVAKGLPASLNLLLRVKAMGSNGMVSDFSTPVLCAVV